MKFSGESYCFMIVFLFYLLKESLKIGIVIVANPLYI